MATSATTAGNKKSSSGATKAELAARKAPEMLSPHQFAAILTRKLEELQIKQQGFKLVRSFLNEKAYSDLIKNLYLIPTFGLRTK